MSQEREDAVCPYCPPGDPFTIRDTGMKFDQETITASALTIRVTRRLWELEMMEHLRVKHLDRWRELIDAMASSIATERARRRSQTDARMADQISLAVLRQQEAGL